MEKYLAPVENPNQKKYLLVATVMIVLELVYVTMRVLYKIIKALTKLLRRKRSEGMDPGETLKMWWFIKIKRIKEIFVFLVWKI